MKKIHRVLAIGAGGLVVVGATALTINAVAAPNPAVPASDVAAAESVLVDGWDATQKAPVSDDLPAAPSASQMTASQDRGASTDALANRKAAAKAKLAHYFTGKALADTVTVTGRGIDSTNDPTFKAVGGGADSLKVTNVDIIDANTLHITGTLHVWSNTVFYQDGKVIAANPSNLLDVDETLARQADGSWAVSDYTWKFHAGSEP